MVNLNLHAKLSRPDGNYYYSEVNIPCTGGSTKSKTVLSEGQSLSLKRDAKGPSKTWG